MFLRGNISQSVAFSLPTRIPSIQQFKQRIHINRQLAIGYIELHHMKLADTNTSNRNSITMNFIIIVRFRNSDNIRSVSSKLTFNCEQLSFKLWTIIVQSNPRLKWEQFIEVHTPKTWSKRMAHRGLFIRPSFRRRTTTIKCTYRYK